MPFLKEIWVYPVKSLPGIRMASAKVVNRGFDWDRHWMLIDQNGRFVTQRELPGMALFDVQMDEQGVAIGHRKNGNIRLNFSDNSGQDKEVQIWRDRVKASLIGKLYDEWFSDCLKKTVRLVAMKSTVTRLVDQEYAGITDQTGFADGFPFLLLGEASIADLEQRVNDPSQRMTVRRFRPNLLIAGVDAYAEDHWHRIKIGDVGFRLVKPCSRCSITTLDPDSARQGQEPLKTLALYRRKGKRVYFGQNVIHDELGVLHEGDVVEVLE